MDTGSGADLLYGLDAIGAHLGLTARQVQHQITLGSLPTFKMGEKVCATKSGLAAHFAAKIQAGG